MAHVFKKCILILLELQKKKKRRNKERKRKKIHNEISRSKMTWCLGFAKKIEKEKKGIDKANGEKYY